MEMCTWSEVYNNDIEMNICVINRIIHTNHSEMYTTQITVSRVVIRIPYHRYRDRYLMDTTEDARTFIWGLESGHVMIETGIFQLPICPLTKLTK